MYTHPTTITHTHITHAINISKCLNVKPIHQFKHNSQHKPTNKQTCEKAYRMK